MFIDVYEDEWCGWCRCVDDIIDEVVDDGVVVFEVVVVNDVMLTEVLWLIDVIDVTA